MAKTKMRRVVTYGVYTYHKTQKNPRCPGMWDLHSSTGSKDAAMMQARMLFLQTPVDRVEVTHQCCNPLDGICNTKTIHVLDRAQHGLMRKATAAALGVIGVFGLGLLTLIG